MRRVTSLAFLALLVLVSQRGLAQEPLRVEIVTSTPQQRDPILVRVTNLTAKTLQLALPLYFYGRTSLFRQTLASDPLDIEQKKGRHWVEIPLGLPSAAPSASPQIEAGQTKEYRFGVVGAGEYRVRVWYVVSPPQAGPPPRPAKYASVVSTIFKVN